MQIRCVHVDYVGIIILHVPDEVVVDVEVLRSLAANGVAGKFDGFLVALADLV